MFPRFAPRQNGKANPSLSFGLDAKPEGRRESPRRKGRPEASSPAPNPATTPKYETTSQYVALKVALHQELLDTINLSAIEELAPAQLRTELAEISRELLGKKQVPLNNTERVQLVSDLIDEFLGLGPIEPLLKDPTVADILVNTYAQVFVERFGRIEQTQIRFKDDGHLMRIIDRIVSRVGRRVDESQPMVDARLADGSRVNAIIPPLALDGPSLSIRKFSKEALSIDKLIDVGALTERMAEVLDAAVRTRLNILISGGTGSGKTTMLNALSSFISDRERIVTIEDAAELQLQQNHVVRLETRPANIEGKGEIAQRDLLKNALRMRPDRIIVGEVRGAEAFDMMQAMNTGHEGSMTTVHANSCRDALSRVEQMISMAGFDIPARSIRGQIGSAIHIVVQLQRMSDGRRRLVSLHELTGIEGDVISMHEIFKFRQHSLEADGSINGDFIATGIRPRFAETLASKGIELSDGIFESGARLG